MGKPYSMDLRERVIAAIEGGNVDTPGCSAVFDRHCNGWDLVAAEAGKGEHSPGEARQAEGFRA